MRFQSNVFVIVSSVFFVTADVSFIRSLIRKSKDQFEDEQEQIQIPSGKKCNDPHKLMPLCNKIIPGLLTKSGTYYLSEESFEMRRLLFQQAAKRNIYGTCAANRHLTTRTLRHRQQYAGKILDAIKPKNILDIGPYANPIHAFMTHCPESVFMIEPCGELAHNGDKAWSSEEVSCGSDGSTSIHNVIPQKIKTFIHSSYAEYFDAVVCIGCDKHHGPTWGDLMSLPRPFHLILEYASAYPFPVGNKIGCSTVETKEFDLSSCPDCDYDDPKVNAVMGRYEMSRKFFIFNCTDEAESSMA